MTPDKNNFQFRNDGSKEAIEYELMYDYIDDGRRIIAGTKFTIKSVWSNYLETTFGLISFEAFDRFAIEIKTIPKVVATRAQWESKVREYQYAAYGSGSIQGGKMYQDELIEFLRPLIDNKLTEIK